MKDKNLEKYMSVFENMDERQRYLVFIVILVFVFILDYLVLMKPQINALMTIGPKINMLAEDIKLAKQNISQLEYFQGEVDKVKEKWTKANEKIRPKEEIPLILRTIDELARKNDVKIEQITPNREDEEILSENKERKFMAIPIVIEASSGYHKFGRFLNQIERGDVLLKVKNLLLRQKENSQQLSIQITLEAVIYEDVDAETGVKSQSQVTSQGSS